MGHELDSNILSCGPSPNKELGYSFETIHYGKWVIEDREHNSYQE